MYEIKYGIQINESGRPYIQLPDDYDQKPEDRFFILEIARYMLQDLLNRKIQNLDSDTIDALSSSEQLLTQISDEVAKIIYESMRLQGEMKMILDNKYHISVNTIEERDALPEKNIIHNNAIYDRIEGLKIFIKEEIELYELVNGITNENWVKL